jgi:AGCS family alanine or glycine:cation symporter
MEEIIGVLNDIVWSDCCFVFRDRALFFHKNTFCRLRHIKEMFRLLFDGKSSESEFLLFKHYQCHWQSGYGEYCK